MTDKDKALVAAYFVQSKSNEDTFKTREVTKLLAEQRSKIANPALAIKRHGRAKRLFSVKSGVFRVSDVGIHHLKSLLSNESE